MQNKLISNVIRIGYGASTTSAAAASCLCDKETTTKQAHYVAAAKSAHKRKLGVSISHWILFLNSVSNRSHY